MGNFLKSLIIVILLGSCCAAVFEIDERIKDDVEKIARKYYSKEIEDHPHLAKSVRNSGFLKQVFENQVNSKIYVGKTDKLEKLILPYIQQDMNWRLKAIRDWDNFKNETLNKYPHFDKLINDAVAFWWKKGVGANQALNTMKSDNDSQKIILIKLFYDEAEGFKNLIHSAISTNIIDFSQKTYRMNMTQAIDLMNEAKVNDHDFYKLEMLFNVEKLFNENEIYKKYVQDEISKFNGFKNQILEANPNFHTFIDEAILFWWKSGKNSKDLEKLVVDHKSELGYHILNDIQNFYDSSLTSKTLVNNAIDLNIIGHYAKMENYDENELKEKLKQFPHEIGMLFNYKTPSLKQALKKLITKTATSTPPPPKLWNCSSEFETYFNDKLNQSQLINSKKFELSQDSCIKTEVCAVLKKENRNSFTNTDLYIYFNYVENFVTITDIIDDMFYEFIGEKLIENHNFTKDQAFCAEKFMRRDEEFENSYTGVDLLADEEEHVKIAQKVGIKYKNLFL